MIRTLTPKYFIYYSAEATKNLTEDQEDRQKIDRLKKWIEDTSTGLDNNDSGDKESAGRNETVEPWRPYRVEIVKLRIKEYIGQSIL